MNILETNNLTKSYSDRLIVNKLNIGVKKGGIYVLVGCNGAGKTTTLRMITGLLKPTCGETIIFGEKLNRNNMRMFQRIGALIGKPSFYENLTAQENLEIIASLRGTHSKECVYNALKLVDLQYENKKKVRELSCGMMQRLGIAFALMHEPELVILDEPVNSIDPIGIQEMRFIIHNLCKERNVTFLLTSHILSEVEQIADRVGILHKGNLLKEASIDDIRKNNRNYIRMKVSSVTRSIPILENKLGISDFEVEDNDVLKIYEIYRNTEKINRVLNENNIGVSEIYMSKGNLEEYFNNVTGGNIVD